MESQNDNHARKFNSQQAHPFLTSPRNIIVSYTLFRVLMRIKRHLGLEAMLEYIEKYCSLLEKNNTSLGPAVDKALSIINVEKIYHDVQ